jgi:signal transduction histidine kinase
MRERAELLEGTITVDTGPGRGTTITGICAIHRRASESGC